MYIKNLTQHAATPEQIAAGVVDLAGDERTQLVNLLNFSELPTRAEILARAIKLAFLAGDANQAMIGGAPFLMSALENALTEVGIDPIYSFSVRCSAEKLVDGVVVKTSSFSHAGFVSTCDAS